MPRPPARSVPGASRAGVADQLERASGQLATSAITKMELSLPWYAALPAVTRSVVGLVAQAGIAAFIEWFRNPGEVPTITADVFGSAPREVAREVTLRQAVELVRSTVDVVERYADDMPDEDERALLREAVLRYSREVAFAAAEVYAQAAETRGAWDARLESLVVDGVVRGEDDDALRSRAAALGWGPNRPVAVAVGATPVGDPEQNAERLRRDARLAHVDLLTGTHGDRLLAVIGGRADPVTVIATMADSFGPGALVVGPVVDGIAAAGRSARAAISGFRAAAAWPDAPRPVAADDLLPERALAGDPVARRQLVEEVYAPLAAVPSVLDTVTTYLEQALSVEATARSLFIHPNTVRYRLRRAADLAGHVPTDARGGYTLRTAVALGRLAAAYRP
jgi:hypothetical protein